MTRLVPALLVLGLLAVPLGVAAAPHKPPPSSAPADDRAQNGGVIDGRVLNVDYARGTLTVDSGPQGKVDVTTMPTTSVQSDAPGYHVLTDVAKGAHVQIFTSKIAGKFVAQIIRLLKH